MKIFNRNDARANVKDIDAGHAQRWVSVANQEYRRLRRLGNKEQESQQRAVKLANKEANTKR